MIIGRCNKILKAIQCPIPLEVKNQMLLNKINLVTAMTVLMFGLMPVEYAHNQDWNDGFKSGAGDSKTIEMGAGDDDVTCPNNGYNDSQRYLF